MRVRTAISVLVVVLSAMAPAVLHAQQNSTTGMYGFWVREKNDRNIGFTAFDLQYPLLANEKFSVTGGLRLIGAATGKRGGYFAFGYCSDLILRPQRHFQLGFGTALLAGGGAAAPDDDGWLLQGTGFLQYGFDNGLRLRAGLNYAYVSGGAIRGFSPLAGLHWNLRTLASDSSELAAFAWNAAYTEFGIARSDGQELGFAGAGAGWTYGNFLAGDFAIHALANTHGGYMQTLFSGGPAFSWRSLRLSPAAIVGLGGGGGVKTVGGSLFGAQLALTYNGKRFYAGIKYQHVQAFSKQFGYSGLFASVGKTFQLGSTPAIEWYLISKAYLGKEGFGNIGARFIGYEYKGLRLMGSTYWAFTHDRGAYAEGLFEATLNTPRSLPFYVVASCGAGAGAGINRRSESIIYSAGIGFASPWKRVPFQLEAAYGSGGNVPNWSISLAYRI